VAGSTGLEPAASAVTGRRSNQLNYDPELLTPGLTRPGLLLTSERTSKFELRRSKFEVWAVQDSNL
jgi:hypothetical protein